jgi:outer membrane receptor for monomeric catechols
VARQDLFDMERIEVVKGPQATLFGTAAEVGAVSLISARPKPGFSASMHPTAITTARRCPASSMRAMTRWQAAWPSLINIAMATRRTCKPARMI